MLFVLSATQAWTAGCRRPRSYTTITMAATLSREPVPVDAALQRLRLMWDQSEFQSSANIVNTTIAGEKIFLKPQHDAIASSYDDTMFAPLFGGSNTLVSSDPTSDNKNLRMKKKAFALTIAYRGTDFCGWQTQVDNILPSVQESLETHLAVLQGDRVDVRVCGRTDSGVSAIGQVCRYRTLLDIDENVVQSHLDKFPMKSSLQCVAVQRVSLKFHPSFGAKSRAYVYLIDPGFLSEDEVEGLSDILRELENKVLDYVAVSYGKVKTQSTECTLFSARAFQEEKSGACVIQLVGNRFLRRMVRILVSTALMQVFRHETSLLPLLETKNRTVCAPPAPPHGLIFVAADFEAR